MEDLRLLAYISILCCISVAHCVKPVIFIKSAHPCDETCVSTYPLHTYEKGMQQHYCRRGCRLRAVLGLASESRAAHKLCRMSCAEAYPVREEDQQACAMGCQAHSQHEQVPQLQHPRPLLIHVLTRAWVAGSGPEHTLHRQVHLRAIFVAQPDMRYFRLMRLVADSRGVTSSELWKGGLQIKRGPHASVSMNKVSRQRKWWGCVAERALPHLQLLLCLLVLASCLVFGLFCCQSLLTAPKFRVLHRRAPHVNMRPVLSVNSGDVILPVKTFLPPPEYQEKVALVVPDDKMTS